MAEGSSSALSTHVVGWPGGASEQQRQRAMTVPELAELAVRRGLDFIAVTDHNTVSHHAELPAASRRYGITLVPG